MLWYFWCWDVNVFKFCFSYFWIKSEKISSLERKEVEQNIMCLISFRFSCFNSVPYSSMYCCVLQAWSITYHSWLTFVLLLAACFIWMVPQSRKACLLCSPAVVLYGEVLLIIQFVYGMNLTELPEESNGIKLDEIGLKKFKYPCLQLALQVNANTT